MRLRDKLGARDEREIAGAVRALGSIGANRWIVALRLVAVSQRAAKTAAADGESESASGFDVGRGREDAMVLWLAEKFVAEGKRVAILARVSRGGWFERRDRMLKGGWAITWCSCGSESLCRRTTVEGGAAVDCVFAG